jgi:hypothetical protein
VAFNPPKAGWPDDVADADLFIEKYVDEVVPPLHARAGAVAQRLCDMNPLSTTNASDVALRLERWEELVAASPIPPS